ncbi:MAG: DUF1501 domain-containing protein [Deltaproteobacteria bacterium]|nr:DUF1501 domain-containing protein [Deltaproteobacteria bacterium]
MCKYHKIVTRRDFVKLLGLSAAGASLLPFLRPTVAFAQAAPPLNGPVDIYIRVYFSGGVDGLTMVPPKNATLHAALKSRRPVIMGPVMNNASVPGGSAGSGLIESASQVLDIGQTWGLHPYWSAASNAVMTQNQLPGIYELMNQGQAKILSKIGFPELPSVSGASAGPAHDLNHVTATDPWNVGKTQIDPSSDLFWETRLMQQAQMQWNQFWVLGVGGQSIPARPYPGGPSPTITRFLNQISRFEVNDYDVRANGQSLGGSAEVSAAQDAIQQILALPDDANTATTKREYKRGMRAALDTGNLIHQNVAALSVPSYFPGNEMNYPYGIDENFRDVARIIQYYYLNPTQRRKLLLFIGLPNFDTHLNQASVLPGYLKGINHCVGALQRYLTANGVWNKTVIQFVSEFGRGVVSPLDGTPHGWGSMHFLLGGGLNAASGPVFGELPTLSDITNPIPVGDPSNPESTLLRATLDPREVYFRVVEAMGFNAASVFAGYQPTSTQSLFS